MNTSGDHDGRPLLLLVDVCGPCSDRQKITAVACNRLAQQAALGKLCDALVLFQRQEVPLKVTVSVGVAVSNVHYVFIVLRRVLKRQTIIELTISVVAGLERRNILVEDCCWTKCAVPTKWSRVLVPKCSLCSACLIIGNVKAFSLPTYFNFFCFFYCFHFFYNFYW